MRIRIALATASTVSFMITSFNTQPAGAQTPARSQQAGKTTDLTATVPAVDVPVLYPAIVSKVPSDTREFRSAVGRALWRKMVRTVPLAPPPVATPPPAPVAPTPPTDATSTNTADWQCIRVQESGDVYHSPTRPSGAYGILEITWSSYGYSGWPYQASAAVQDALALQLYNTYGWSPWSSRYACGL